MKPTKVTIQKIILADIKKVWDYYTEPEHITQWNFAADDWQCPRASNDLKVGGKYSARMEAKDGSFGFDFDAIYDEIIDGEKLSYTMADGREAGIIFNDLGNKTEVVVTFDADTENQSRCKEMDGKLYLIILKS